jgi:hypothetical protein
VYPPHIGVKMDKNAIVAKMMDNSWKWADQDLNALLELEKRIADTGKNEDLITYSDLVRGVTFNLPTVNGGKPFQITSHDWTDLNRAILGDFMGYISTRSFATHGFMASALVVNKIGDQKPSDIFFRWMQYLGVLPDGKPSTRDKFWSNEVKKAHQWYRTGTIE